MCTPAEIRTLDNSPQQPSALQVSQENPQAFGNQQPLVGK
jgi:hypothetical protein